MRMSKQEKKGLLPELRFPEFQDNGKWKLEPLKKLASKRTERNRDGKVLRVLTNSAEHGVVDQRDYFDKDIATQGNLENYFIVDRGDFVYNPRISAFAPVGPISRNNVATGVMSPLYTVFRFKNYDIDFYAHYFKSTAWHLYMRQVGSTGARHDRMAITNDDFLAMPLPVPSVKEQQEIADCLTSIDDLITTQTQKVDALKAHKKGLMQQLFPAEGETVPKLRFPEFRDKGEWKEKKLSDVIQLISGLHLSPSDYGDSGSTPYFTGPSDFTNSESEISKWTDTSANTATKHDVLITVKGNGVGELWFLTLSTVAIGRQLMAVRSKSCVRQFIYHLLNTQKTTFEVLGSGNLIPGLSRPVILGLTLRIPSKKEQQKIADCLTSLDELITAETKKIDTLKAHKKGLMQQLFPVMDEVSL